MSKYERAFAAVSEALQQAGNLLEPEERGSLLRTLGVLRRLAQHERESTVRSDPQSALEAMNEDPQRRELYLGAGGPWCWVTETNGGFRVSLEDALAMERGGLVRRKWPDYAHWWVLADYLPLPESDMTQARGE